MKNIYLKALAFLVALGCFYSIEILYFGQSDRTTGEAGLVLLGLLAPILTLAFPHFSRRSLALPVVGWGVVFLAAQLLVLGAGALDAAGILRLMLRLGIFLVVIGLAHVLSRSLLQFYLTVRELTQVAPTARLLVADETTPAVRRELARSRQYERPLSVIVLEEPPAPDQEAINRLILEAQQAFLQEYYHLKFVEAVRQSLRPMDVLMTHGNRLAILCPEGTEGATYELSARIRANVAAKLALPIEMAAARFPEEGLTFAGLLATADERLDERAAATTSRQSSSSSLLGTHST